MDVDVWFDDLVGSEVSRIVPLSEITGSAVVEGSVILVPFLLVENLAREGVWLAATADDASGVLSVWLICTEFAVALDASFGRSSGVQTDISPSNEAGESAVCMAMERL